MIILVASKIKLLNNNTACYNIICEDQKNDKPTSFDRDIHRYVTKFCFNFQLKQNIYHELFKYFKYLEVYKNIPLQPRQYFKYYFIISLAAKSERILLMLNNKYIKWNI